MILQLKMAPYGLVWIVGRVIYFVGFSLGRVRALLTLSDDCDRSCEAVDAIAKERLDEVDRKISDLQALRRELDGMLRRCRSGTVAECRIIEALSPQ